MIVVVDLRGSDGGVAGALVVGLAATGGGGGGLRVLASAYSLLVSVRGGGGRS
jgi:hypothetical protein